MKHRPFLKRLILIGLPLGILVAVWAVGRYSPKFEGRRWLRERASQAVRMSVYETTATDWQQEPYLVTTDREEIQNTLWLVNCVGSLTDRKKNPQLKIMSAPIVVLRLEYEDGGVDGLMLCEASGLDGWRTEQYLVHHYSASNRKGQIGVARMDVDNWRKFHAALRNLPPKSSG